MHLICSPQTPMKIFLKKTVVNDHENEINNKKLAWKWSQGLIHVSTKLHATHKSINSRNPIILKKIA